MMKKIQILGPGCVKCVNLYNNTKRAVEELNLECSIEKVTDIEKIMNSGVMMTPALVVNGDVKSSGKVPTVEEIKKMLT